LSIKLDETDIYILRALLEDGRATYRQIARSLAISTPTIEARIKKMKDMGLIKKFSPIIDADKLRGNITAILTADADLQHINQICEDLSRFDEIREIYLTTGEHNMIMKVVVDDIPELQEFEQQKLSKVQGIKPLSSYVVTKTIKEEQRARLKPGMGLRLHCDTCKGEIKGSPVTVMFEDRPRFFCCEICAETFRKKWLTK
jgi:Lrp/AsnC family transcriptional regulator for asnA, asnC and gidA